MKHLLQKTFALKALLLMSLLVGAVNGAWADGDVTLVSGSGTSGYAVPTDWTSSGTVEGGQYLKFENGTITSPEFAPHTGLSFAYSVATFGSGTNHPLTIRILNASTDEVIVEETTSTPTSSTYINTGSPLSLGDINVAFKIQLYGPTGKGVRLRNYSITGYPANSLENSDLTLTDAPVALSFDLYNNSSTQVISYTTSSTGAVTIADNDYATFDIDEVNKTITVTPIAVTPSEQTITVSVNQAADNTYKSGSATFTVTISDSTPVPTHTVTFSMNGVTTTSEVEEGATIQFPSNVSSQEGKSFVGWVTSAINGTTNDVPPFVTPSTMGDADVTYYAVYAHKQAGTESSVEDVLNNATTGISGSTYKDWSGKTDNSGAVYAGQSAGDKNSIQLRSNNSNSGVITTTSGGKVKKIVVDWNSNTSSGRTLNVYVKHTAYSAATDLYDNKQGTLIGTVAYDGTHESAELTINGDYEFIGFRSASGAMYLDEVTITWQSGTPDTFTDYCTTVVADSKQDAELSFSDTEVNANISEQFVAPTLNTAGGFNGTVEYTSSDESVAQIMDSETGELRLLKEGTTTITATFAGNNDFRPGSASYTLNVTDNRIATTTFVEDIVLDIADIASLTQLTPVVKDAEDNIIDCTYEEFPPKVSYEIVSDEKGLIGSIDNNSGEITLNAVVGTATLKAFYNAFNVSETYKPSECTFTITVESTQTIAEARAQGTGSVTTKGVVTSCSGTTAYIQDATAAICVYGSALTVGDEVKVNGTLKDYNGLLEITNPTVTVRSQGNTITPEVMTIADINASENQGWLVKIEDATVTAINGQNTTIAQGDNTIVVRGISGVEIAVNDVITLTGNIGCYNVAQIANPTDVAVKVAAPTFNPESGEVVAGSPVTISTTTEDATIYYTIDGTEPTTESTAYAEPITISEATTIKAIAVKEGMTNSTVATATYTIALPVATPTFTPAAGTYDSAQEVTISCETDDATIYYSYDNENWTEYTETLNINETKTVYAKAEKEGLVTSYANVAYTIQIPSITFVNDATPKNLTYEAQNYDFAFEGAYTTGSFAVVVCDYEGNATSYDWFSAELNGNAVRVTLTQNEDTENGRTAFFKVTADNATSEVFSVVQNNYVAPVPTIEREWAKTELSALNTADIFVIVGSNEDEETYALSSANGTSKAPEVAAVTIVENKITSDVTDDIQWNLGINAEGGYTFYPNNETDKWLYCTNTNNGVRVGTNDNNVFTFDGYYLFNNATKRYVGIYNSQDWRCYTTYGGNIADQTVSFYRLVPNYERSVVVDNWGTICLPYDADVSGAQLYSIAGWRENEKGVTSIVLKEETSMEAGKPYFFQATALSINCYQTSVEVTKRADTVNGLVGSFERMDVEEGMYLLSKGEIVRCGTGCSIAANRAYIDMSQVPEYVETGEAGVKMLYLYNPTTGINGIDANGEGAVIYDLSGRRLSKTQKGLYIVNGKKVAVK